jgi:OOP family OmpA-OmpF porin
MARRSVTSLVALALVALGATACPRSARAQGLAGALDRFEPSPSGDGFFAVPGADVVGRFAPSATLLASYADAPLVLREVATGDARALVERRVTLFAQASVELFARLKLDLSLPLVPLQEGAPPQATAPSELSVVHAASAGDLRVGLRAVLLRPQGLSPGAALSFSVWAPTGDVASLMGGGSARFAPALHLGGEGRWLVYGGSLGRRFEPRPATGAHVGGSDVHFTLGAYGKLGPVRVGPELFGSIVTQDVEPLTSNQVAAELLVAARGKLGPVELGLAGGPGLSRRVGTPTYRLLASVGISHDFGILPRLNGPEDDARPGLSRLASPRPAPAPAPPPEAAAPAAVAAPPDGDGDGVPDAQDACPTVKGERSADAKKHGCAPDRDGDGIADASDACPREAGPASESPDKHGCPVDVRVEGSQIVILQRVEFATGSDVLLASSHGVLGAVAKVMSEHPEIARLAVEGHTDSKGSEKANLALAQRRAVAVVRWLSERGVDARRLEARGFGPRRPLADNGTEDGRQKNRRVEFHIVKRSERGADEWREGRVD